MKLGLKLKVITLVICFMSVLWTIQYVQKGHLSETIQAIGYLSESSPVRVELSRANAEEGVLKQKTMNKKIIKATRPGVSSSAESLRWCETRVKSLQTKSGLKVEQEGMNWITVAPEKKGLDTVAIEKWLAKYCTLAIQDPRPPPFVPTKNDELLAVEFIDGEKSSFALTPSGFLTWDGLLFKSEQFETMVAELKKLADEGIKK
ncbi:MAG: hypothetical protein SGJ18_07725 [Pseudomonadota bacterium]|nr:hypothetical protein [Pseudomonadota bacterium]